MRPASRHSPYITSKIITGVHRSANYLISLALADRASLNDGQSRGALILARPVAAPHIATQGCATAHYVATTSRLGYRGRISDQRKRPVVHEVEHVVLTFRSVGLR